MEQNSEMFLPVLNLYLSREDKEVDVVDNIKMKAVGGDERQDCRNNKDITEGRTQYLE